MPPPQHPQTTRRSQRAAGSGTRGRGSRRLPGPAAARTGASGLLVQDVQRSRLLTATVEVAAGEGAENLTVAAVVARAGVSRRTFYQLFESADDCLLAALGDAVDRAAAEAIPAYRSEERWIDAIDAAVVALLAFFDRQPATARLLLVEALAAGPKALELRQALLQELASTIAEGKEACTQCSPPPATAEALVGGVASILHSRLVAPRPKPLLPLAGELVSLILLPYLDAETRAKELPRPARKPPKSRAPRQPRSAPPRPDVQLRLTQRTMLVLLVLAQQPDASNRAISDAAGIRDQGQVSKLLRRLERHGIARNRGSGSAKGAANAWRLTDTGNELVAMIESSGLSR